MIVERERVARAERQSQPSGERVVRGESSQRARARESTRDTASRSTRNAVLCARGANAPKFFHRFTTYDRTVSLHNATPRYRILSLCAPRSILLAPTYYGISPQSGVSRLHSLPFDHLPRPQRDSRDRCLASLW